MERCLSAPFVTVVAACIALAWTPAFAAQDPFAPTPLVGPAPAEGLPNLNGVWDNTGSPAYRNEQSVRAAFGGDLPPFTPFGLEQWLKRDLSEDPTGLCQPSGFGRILRAPNRIQILQTHGMVVVLSELYWQFHRIFTDGRGHPDEIDPTWWGHSIGRYEGNKLIVDTVGMNDRTWIATAGLQHSEQLHLIQTFEPTGPDTLHITETYADPVYFTRPWSIDYDMGRQENDLMEYICLDNLNKGVEYYLATPAEGNSNITGVPSGGSGGAEPQ
jgi:hypothetical protein